MAVALLTIPPIVRALGVERFGLLTLVWMVIGYFSLFDLGLGRALTQLVANRLGESRDAEVPNIIWTALAAMTAFGILGGALLAAMTPWLVGSILKIPAALQPETRVVFFLLAIAVPSVTLFPGVRGILEARQLFQEVNLIRIPIGILSYLAPWLVLKWVNSLPMVVLALMVVRTAGLWLFWIRSRQTFPALREGIHLDRALIRPLLCFGGWLTVSNIISPIMANMDRFFISAVLGVGMVGYYTTPFEVVTKLLILPGALVGVLFPLFSSLAASRNPALTKVYNQGMAWILIGIGPLVLAIMALAHPFLRIWLGPEFARQGTRVMQILAFGVLANGLAAIPFALVQGLGRPIITAKLHMAELPVYFACLILSLHYYGITGAAMVWSLRMLVDLIMLHLIARRQMVPMANPVSSCSQLEGSNP